MITIQEPLQAPQKTSWIEVAFAYIGLTFYNQAVTSVVRNFRGADRAKAGEADLTSSIVQAFMILGLVLIIYLRRSDYAKVPKYIVPYLLIMGLCFISFLWSEDPGATLRRTISLLCCGTFGIYMCLTFGMDRLLDMIARNAVVLAIVSIIVYFAIPSIGHESNEGYTDAMRGIFNQKNSMGECMVIGGSCFAYAIVREGRLRVLPVLGLVLMFGCLVLGRTGTSMASLSGSLLVAYYFYFRSRRPMRLMMTAFLVVVLLTVVVLALRRPTCWRRRRGAMRR